jgi:hypothetical protein
MREKRTDEEKERKVRKNYSFDVEEREERVKSKEILGK